jgi:hypothetical protein
MGQLSNQIKTFFADLQILMSLLKVDKIPGSATVSLPIIREHINEIIRLESEQGVGYHDLQFVRFMTSLRNISDITTYNT